MKLFSAVGGLLALFWGAQIHATTLFFEDFEDAGATYDTSIPVFTDLGTDYFLATDGSNIAGEVFSNIQDLRFFAAQDIDGEGAALPVSLRFSGIDIHNASNLSLSVFLAEDDDGTREDWDRGDFFTVSYSIDGGVEQNLLSLRNDGSLYNSAPFLDTDFDGIGDGAEITSVFTEYSASISGSGSLLDLIFTFSLDATDEDIALDNIQVSGQLATPVPLPPALPMFFSALAFWFLQVRRRKELRK